VHSNKKRITQKITHWAPKRSAVPGAVFPSHMAQATCIQQALAAAQLATGEALRQLCRKPRDLRDSFIIYCRLHSVETECISSTIQRRCMRHRFGAKGVHKVPAQR
jgi:hypothetical protein